MTYISISSIDGCEVSPIDGYDIFAIAGCQGKRLNRLFHAGFRLSFLFLSGLLLSFVPSSAATMTVQSPDNIGVAGIYSGMIPCADCEGILYRLALTADGRYEERLTYKGRSAAPNITKGHYTVEGDSLVRLGKKDPAMSLFRISPDGLMMLDREGHAITGDLAGHYTLTKLRRGPGAEGSPQDSLRAKRAFLYKKWRAGIGFYGTGNEHSWSLDINFRRFMRFILDGDTLTTPISKGAKAADVNMIRYYMQTPKGTLTVQIFEQECMDAMSGEKSDCRVTVDVQKPGETDSKRYEGCGNYIPDFRLEGNWKLQEMNGGKPDSADYPRGMPNLEINVTEGRFGGLAGCNRMMGKLVKSAGNRIRFGPIASTLMFCPNMAKETALHDALGKVDSYWVMRDQLRLAVRGKVVLVFSRGAKGAAGSGGGSH